MVSVHFTTIPWKPYTAQKLLRKAYFCNFCLCTYANDIAVFARFVDVRIFLYVFIGAMFMHALRMYQSP